ncbi:MAG: hypothetical protein IT245_01770 [Bacteroidia bacterium]|nr:hypothetical protein [Bacteroidia bacterium]
MQLRILNSAQWSIATWKRIVFSFVLLALLYFWYSGMMLHHVWDSPFQYKGADLTYWFLHSLRVDKLLTSNQFIAQVFSFVLISFFVLASLFPKKRSLAIVSGILLLFYQVIFNMKLGYHTHHLFGFQFALLPFYFKESLFKPSLGLAKVLCCLSYFFAGFFKLYQGAWLSFDSFSHVLSNQHAAYLYFNPTGIRSLVVHYMISHPSIGFMFFISAMIVQLSFIVGVFSNKWNKYLAVFIVLFHVMDWFLMNLGVFMGMTLLVWLLIYPNRPKIA